MNAVALQTDIINKPRLRIVHAHQAALYEELGDFIKAVYKQRYGAARPKLLPVLVALESSEGELLAACGLSFGSEDPFFLEQYLDETVEKRIGQQNPSADVARRHIVEVGNLCAAIPSGGRLMIVALCQWLCERGLQWVVFTGTTQLRNGFSRVGIELEVLGKADPARLQGNAEDWGRYYHSKPQVMAGNIRANHARLQSVNHTAAKNLLPLHLDVIVCDAVD
jgi:Thermostable hemolysin